MSLNRCHYYTSQEFITEITTGYRAYRFGIKSVRNTEDYTTSFFGVSFDKALDLYANGWPEGLKGFEELRSQITDLVLSNYAASGTCYEVYGGVPDVGVFLSGDPENMIHRRPMEDRISTNRSAMPVVKMVVNIGASNKQDNKTLSAARGAMACAILDALEALGQRVELWAGHSAKRLSAAADMRYPEPTQELYILLKSAGSELELERVSFALCHNSMLRRLALAWNETIGHDSTMFYGGPGTISDKGDVFIDSPEAMGMGQNLDYWASKTLEILEAAGVTLKES